MKMNKKGDFDTGWEEGMGIIFAALIFIFLFIYVGMQASGGLIQEQTIAKEVCMIASSAREGSSLEIVHAGNIIIEGRDSGIIVKSSKSSVGYFYPCYLNNAEFSVKDNKTSIMIK